MSCAAHAIEDWDDGDASPEDSPAVPTRPQSWWQPEKPRQSYSLALEGVLARVARASTFGSAFDAALDEAQERIRRWSAELTEDDDDGAVPVAPETLERAIMFLRRTADAAVASQGISIDIPKILPGPDGSIDILWRSGRYDLLINIPPGPETLADFYGDRPDGLTIKGTFRPEVHNDGILAWLAGSD